VVYCVERERQEREDLTNATAVAFARVLSAAFGGKTEDSGEGASATYVGHNPMAGERK
jgi:hypothetical protein